MSKVSFRHKAVIAISLIAAALAGHTVFARPTEAATLPFHPPASHGEFARMEDRITLNDLVILSRIVAEDEGIHISDYSHLRFDINCDGLITITDVTAAINFFCYTAKVDTAITEYESESRVILDLFVENLRQKEGLTVYGISVFYNGYPDQFIPFLNIGRPEEYRVKYAIERVYSYSFGDGTGIVTSTPDPYYNTIHYTLPQDEGFVMTLIVWKFKTPYDAYIVGETDILLKGEINNG